MASQGRDHRQNKTSRAEALLGEWRQDGAAGGEEPGGRAVLCSDWLARCIRADHAKPSSSDLSPSGVHPLPAEVSADRPAGSRDYFSTRLCRLVVF